MIRVIMNDCESALKHLSPSELAELSIAVAAEKEARHLARHVAEHTIVGCSALQSIEDRGADDPVDPHGNHLRCKTPCAVWCPRMGEKIADPGIVDMEASRAEFREYCKTAWSDVDIQREALICNRFVPHRHTEHCYG